MKETPKNTLAELLAAHSASASCGPVLPPAHLHQQNYPEWSFFFAFFWCSNGIHLCKVSQFILLLFSIFLHCQELALKILVFKESNPQFCQQQTMHLEIRLHLCKRLSFPCKSLSQPTLVVQIRLQCCLKLRNLNLQRILCCLEKMTIIVVVVCSTLENIPCISVLSPCQMQSSEVSRCFPFMKNKIIYIYMVVVHSYLRMTLSFSKSLIFSLAWCRDCL